MLRNEKYFALNTLAEYQAACSFPSSYVASAPAVDQFTYETTTEAIHLNSGSTASHFFNYITDTLKIGDIIEVEAEVARLSGDSGKFVIVDPINVSDYTQILSVNNTNEFKKLKTRFIVKKNNVSYKVGVGISSGISGEIKIRGFRVKTFSSYSNSYDFSNYLQKTQMRKCVIEGNVGFGAKFVARSDYATDGVTVAVGIDGITINWATPFDSAKRPVYMVNQDYGGNAPKYILRTGAAQNGYVVVRFYNVTTGALLNIADLDLSSSVFITILGMI